MLTASLLRRHAVGTGCLARRHGKTLSAHIVDTICRHRSLPPLPRQRGLHLSEKRLRAPAAPSADAAPATESPARSRLEHNAAQAAAFDASVETFSQPLPEEVQQRLRDVVDCVPGLGPSSRVIDVGCGTGCLVPHLKARGVCDYLGVDLSPRMLHALRERWGGGDGGGSSVGNEPGVRTWCGDVVDLPPYMGSADAVFFNAVYGNLHDPRAALLHTALALLKPGGHVVVSHPEGRGWHAALHEASPGKVPWRLPGEAEWREVLRGLPLEVVRVKDEGSEYCALLQVPPGYRMAGGPVRMEGAVVRGAGRGSRQMGVATANLDPAEVADAIRDLPAGVYFGWAQLLGVDGEDGRVHKMVMNVGQRPTIDDGGAVSVEVHVMHRYPDDFYGQRMRVLATSFIRPEMRFSGLPELVQRILADVATAKYALDEEPLAGFQLDPFFASP